MMISIGVLGVVAVGLLTYTILAATGSSGGDTQAACSNALGNCEGKNTELAKSLTNITNTNLQLATALAACETGSKSC
ncbi:MAG: hypothetical protein HOH18_02145 [Kordiimonadaceae bacterium]|nr:hypothetical protein [Kordiimonadaceae bacterium]